uniref:MD-2-related lipid-recognition domain-containing protein n=1 Tax=Anopheles culicifacies TaxID=139723 RepID=A0A182LRG2_9DIPT
MRCFEVVISVVLLTLCLNSATAEVVNFQKCPGEEFAADELTADVSWTRTNFDLPFVGMDTEACKHTNCPVASGNRQTYAYNLPIKKEYPPQHYDVKWKLVSKNKESCCFIVQINIARKKKRT